MRFTFRWPWHRRQTELAGTEAKKAVVREYREVLNRWPDVHRRVKIEQDRRERNSFAEAVWRQAFGGQS